MDELFYQRLLSELLSLPKPGEAAQQVAMEGVARASRSAQQQPTELEEPTYGVEVGKPTGVNVTVGKVKVPPDRGMRVKRAQNGRPVLLSVGDPEIHADDPSLLAGP